MLEWMGQVPGGVWALAVTPIVMTLLFRAARRPVQADEDGWVRLRPGIGLLILGVFSIPFAILFTVMPVFALFTADDLPLTLVFVILGPPLAALMWYSAYGSLVVRARFNGKGIEYGGFRRRRFIPWEDIGGIVDRASLGTYVATNRGRLHIWKYRRGFPQLVEEAAHHRIEIDPRVFRP